jgi:TolB-like protein
MASIIPNFEYDIFISYRHNDNRSGWVTDFVNALREELAATIKEPLSIYFDQNPHDGLLETHNVDKSLEGKLKCLIFIPIISQTYCDPKSFAWQHEFVEFNKLARNDDFGRDIKLGNGNVVSRILPIKIHELDAEDKAIIEKEIGGVLRAIEFIFKSAGVNRPLSSTDKREENSGKSLYRDQVNKVANAIKEIIMAIKNPATHAPRPTIKDQSTTNRPKNRKPIFISITLLLLITLGYFLYQQRSTTNEQPTLDKSIAVLPFENMSKDPEQDYFSSGMAEDILNHLTKISDLKVKSRTSTLQYKGTTKSVSEIGDELGVANIVEGSVRKVGDKVRVVVQLIDAKTDLHLWSETYDRDLAEVLTIQSEIAIEIAKALEAKLTNKEKKSIEKEETTDITAYDYYLKARDQYGKIEFSKKNYFNLVELLNKAIKMDPQFSKAYALKARLWFDMSSFGFSQKVWVDSSFSNANKSIQVDPDSPDGYLINAQVNRFLGNFGEYERNIKMAYQISPKDNEVQSNYGYYLLRKGDERGADLILKSVEQGYSTKQSEFFAGISDVYYNSNDYLSYIKILEKVVELNPNTGAYDAISFAARTIGDYEKSRAAAEKLISVAPENPSGFDALAWAYFLEKKYKKAAEYWSKYKEIEARFDEATQTVPFRHRLAMALLKLGDNEKAKILLKQDSIIQLEQLQKKRSTGAWIGRGGLFYDYAVDNALLGNSKAAIQSLDSALKYGFEAKEFFEKDPAFEKIKDLPAFRKVQAKVDQIAAFRKRAFTNALNRAKANNELKLMLDK